MCMKTPNAEWLERTVPAGEFEADCLRLVDEVCQTGTELVVTRHNRPVVRVTPFRQERFGLVGSCRDQLRILTDIDSEPAVPLQDWDMLAQPGGSASSGV